MRKDFYIFRHGETDYNKERRWQGCGLDPFLNDTGVQQAEELAGLLQDKELQVIYASPLKRALQTAEIVNKKLGLPIEIIPDLREGCFGEAEGMLKSEIALKYPDIFEAWYNGIDDLDVGFPGGETKRQMQTRMLGVLNGLLNVPYRRIGIASHGSSIRYLLMAFGEKPHRMPNTALYHLIYDNQSWKLSA